MERINRKIVLAILLSSALVLGAAWFAFFVQLPKIKETSDAVQKEKLDSYVRQQKGDKIYNLKKELSDIESQKKDMEAVFIKKNESVPFFRSIEKVAEESGCQIKISVADISKVKFSNAKQASSAADDESDSETTKKSTAANDQVTANEAAKADEMSKLKVYPAFNIETTGSFASTADFLRKMENISYLVRVLTLDMSPVKSTSSTSGSGAGTLSAGNQSAQNNAPKDEKIVKIDLLVIVYSNDKK